jgi:uncharacterized protein (TIGR03435 family)
MGRAYAFAVGVAVVSLVTTCGFSQASALVEAPEFAVAAIRLHDPQPHERSHIVSSANNGSFQTVNVPLLAIVQYAFAIPDSRIVGAPAWMKTERFDIEAKSDASVDAMLGKLKSSEAKPVKMAMIQALLKDRFHLTVHRETRELPVYDLVVAKGGSKLVVTKSDGLMINHGRADLNGQGFTIAILAQELANDAGRVVVDRTGLDGRYDVDLKWTPDDVAGSADAQYPSLFASVQEQLGLRLDSAKGPVEVLVVDQVEMPSAN